MILLTIILSRMLCCSYHTEWRVAPTCFMFLHTLEFETDGNNIAQQPHCAQ